MPVASLLLLLVLAAPGVLAQTASFQGLGDLPGGAVNSAAYAVSADGRVVVGSSRSADGSEAFRWAGGVMTGLGDLPGGQFGGHAHGVSADGSVVVGLSVSGNGTEAFRWAGGVMTGLGDLPGGAFSSWASGVSADGSVVVGHALVEDNAEEAFRWTAGVMTGLGYTTAPNGVGRSRASGISADGTVVVGGDVRPGFVDFEAVRWVEGAREGLGWPAGTVFSEGLGISADGGTVVGWAVTEAFRGVAYRWRAGAWTPLGLCPGSGNTNSRALAASADGAVVVGSCANERAFVWTAEGGLRDLKAVLEDDYGLDLAGWTLLGARDVSDDGRVIVGDALNPAGQGEAFRAVLPPMFLGGPPLDLALVPGSTFTVTWTAPGATTLDLYYTADRVPSADAGANTLVAAGLDASAGGYTWVVPDTLSPHVRLLLRDHGRPATHAFSARFRVKPYVLTRLRADSTYERFDPRLHAWRFDNGPATWWPAPYYQQFDYGAPDPFTALPYTADSLAAPFFLDIAGTAPIPRRVHPSWPIIVDAVGAGQAYDRLVPGVEAAYAQRPLQWWRGWRGSDGAYRGACYGMVVAAGLAFADPARFGAAFPSIGVVDRLHDVPVAGPAVIHDVNMLLMRQWDGRLRRTRDVRGVLAEVKAMMLRDDRDLDVEVGVFGPNGGHALLPYGLNDLGSGTYQLVLYDPNWPDDIATITLDSTNNRSPSSSISITMWDTGVSTDGPLPLHYEPAVLAWPPAFAPGGGPLAALVHPNEADVMIEGAGGRVGWVASDSLVFEMDGAYPLYPLTGLPSRPYGYELPPGPHRLHLAAPADAPAGASFGSGGGLVGFERAAGAAGPASADRAALDAAGALTLSHEGPDARSYALFADTAPGDAARVLRADGLAIGAGDSVSVALAGTAGADERLVLANRGPAKTYRLVLRHADPGALRLFVHEGIGLAAGATHTAAPDWADLSEVPLLVDGDGDGVPEDTLALVNQTPTSSHSGPHGDPERHGLGAPYPNPARGAAAVPFDVAVAGPVRLAVFDLLGREVAVLLDARVEAGRHEAAFDAAGLSSGVYVVRLTAGAFSSARRLVLSR